MKEGKPDATVRETLVQQYRKRIEPLPERPPLDMAVLNKRRFISYEEWKVEFTAWCSDAMPEPALRRIPAYILIPDDDRFASPYAAAICFHQCNCDCWIGKEAVVGKQVDRMDQAYGYELVRQGFVVLAPDHMLCGERTVPGVREEGERLVGCIPKLIPRTKTPAPDDFERMTTFDAVRSVDLLESLDFVDSSRIAAIGHSLGTAGVSEVMAADSRVKVGITSGGGPNEEKFACIAPRLFMQLQGSFDGGPKKVRELEDLYSRVQRFYEEDGAPNNAVLRIAPCHHHFLDEFKWEAYARLKKHFGMTDAVERLSLADVLRDALAAPGEDDDFDRTYSGMLSAQVGSRTVLGNKRTLTWAFGGFLRGVIKHKYGCSLPLRMAVTSQQDTHELRFTVKGGSQQTQGAKDCDYTVAGQFFADNNATLRQVDAPAALEYVVTLRSAD